MTVSSTSVPSSSALPPRRDAQPAIPDIYQHGLRTPEFRWWRGVLGLAGIAAWIGLFLLIDPPLLDAADLAYGVSRAQLESGAITFTPYSLLCHNLLIASAIPAMMVVQWVAFGVRPRFLTSVVGGFRWRWFARASLVVVPLFGAWIALAVVSMPGVVDFSRLAANAVPFLIVVLLTTPLQSAGEEYVTRGMVTRTVGSFFARPIVALVAGTAVGTALFTVAHLASDPWVITNYVVLSVFSTIAAWRTGGLELSVLIHAANNTVTFLIVVLFGDVNSVGDRGAGSGGPFLLIYWGVLAVVLVAGLWMARRSRVRRLSGTGSIAEQPSRPEA